MPRWITGRRRSRRPDHVPVEELAHAIAWRTGVNLRDVNQVLAAKRELFVRARVVPARAEEPNRHHR